MNPDLDSLKACRPASSDNSSKESVSSPLSQQPGAFKTCWFHIIEEVPCSTEAAHETHKDTDTTFLCHDEHIHKHSN
jgi:hypothetical protein